MPSERTIWKPARISGQIPPDIPDVTFLTAVADLANAGGGTQDVVNLRQPTVGLTNGGVGNATAIYNGTLSVTPEGEWEFVGTVRIEDTWDFDTKIADSWNGTSGRSLTSELKVDIAALALYGGSGFRLVTDDYNMTQAGDVFQGTTSGATLTDFEAYQPDYIGDRFVDALGYDAGDDVQ